MNVYERLPEALGAHLQGRTVAWDDAISPDEWRQLLDSAAASKILPMVYEAVRGCPAFCRAQEADGTWAASYKQETVRLVMNQTRRTVEFAALMRGLLEQQVNAVVVKGLVCRETYPLPDERVSWDEDVIVSPEDGERCVGLLTESGLGSLYSEKCLSQGDVLTFHRQESGLCLEVSTQLFPPGSPYAAFFDGWRDRTVCRPLAGEPMRVPDHTDHMLYLILHAFKHFTGSGVGLRQTCDIVQYANAFGGQVDWKRVKAAVETVAAESFLRAMLAIGRRYLGLQDEAACLPIQWRDCDVPPEPLLRDMVDGGVYGKAVSGREHGGLFTRGAVAAGQSGRAGEQMGFWLKVVFLPRKNMTETYPYLKKYPVLLPVAWVLRAGRYLSRTGGVKGVCETAAIGRHRLELMKQYKVIP